MKIGLDIHGVLSDWEFMTPIVHELIAEGHELYVISGAPKRELEIELVELGYQVEWFKGIYSIIDWLLDNNAPGKIWHNEKGWWYDDDVRWWKTKAEIAEFYEINILLDDQDKYKQGYLKPGTFTLYSTFKSFKGWKDPSSFLLMIASYYRPAPPWKLVAKEDVPVQKLEPPTGMIFFADFKCKDTERKTLPQESKEHLQSIKDVHTATRCGMCKARRLLEYANWDVALAMQYYRGERSIEKDQEEQRLKEAEYHRTQKENERRTPDWVKSGRHG